MTYIKIKTDQAKAEEIKDFYHADEIKDKDYEYFLANKHGVTIHAYKNRKEIYTIVFSSNDRESAIEECTLFSDDYTITETDDIRQKEKAEIIDGYDDLGPQIGSDEVGVGDFFGPLIVVSCYVDNNDIPFIEKYKINDSKKMTDGYIMKIGPIIKSRIKNYVVSVSAKKLSMLEENHMSMHKIMAKCHNHAHKGLMEKYDIPDHIIVYVDQFEKEETYKKYVSDDLISNPMYFRVRGESHYPSVATASVIARYSFLKIFEEMEEKFKVSIPKGASSSVDQVYQLLISKFGHDVVDEYVKKFFRNYQKC